jgi:hypothetical protein
MAAPAIYLQRQILDINVKKKTVGYSMLQKEYEKRQSSIT